ncbi:MAG: SPFH/Band 7/PHB domain protein [Gemmatimonadetes bacterium]|nr:SPFH/Band 7/PHB domain protein [Gemmatimonadota bacterium]
MLYVVGALVLLVITFAALGFKIVPQAETMIIERLGKYHRTLPTGINVIWPLIERPRTVIWRYVREDLEGRTVRTTKAMTRLDLRETVYDFPRQNVITKDNVVTEINALIYFQVTDPRRAVYEIVNLPDAIEKLTQTTLRNVIGEMDLDETLSSRDIINNKLRTILDQATDKWGVKINRVELQDINPPADIRAAMEKQMRAERDRRAVILVAEGDKQARVLMAEGTRIAAVNEAEGAKQALMLMADGEAEARRKVAQAEADAIRVITASITTSGGNPTNYLIAVRYLETLKEMVSGQGNKVVYLPYEATGILGSIGGIRELFVGDHDEA